MSISRSEILFGISLAVIVVSAATAILYLAPADELWRIRDLLPKEPRMQGSMLISEDRVINDSSMAARLHLMAKRSKRERESLIEGFLTDKGIVDSVAPGETKKHNLNVVRSRQLSFTCFCYGELRLAVIRPDGVRIDSVSAVRDKFCSYLNSEITDGQYMISLSPGNNPLAGNWIAEVVNPRGNVKTVYYVLTIIYVDPEI